MPPLLPTPLTVVGAGPAGMMAAYTAAEAGLDVALIDENPLPGGQYYRQSPPEFRFAHANDAISGRADASMVLNRLSHPKIKLLRNTQVWGVFDHHKLGLANQDQSFILPAERVILATGAYDRPLAFPGWTLPGVMGAGAALRMIKTQWVLPGRRILLAGLGPLQLALADILVKAGAEVVCVAEAANPLKSFSVLPRLWGHWDRIGEAIAYTFNLSRHHVPVLYNHAIVSACGKDRVETAVLCRLDDQGAPVPGTEKRFEVDAICLGYGLLPAFQLAAAFGCKLEFDADSGWFVPGHDACMESSEPGVFVAGDVAGIAGSKVALLEGQIAGLTAAYQLGMMHEQGFQERLAPISSRLKRLQRLASTLQQLYAFRPGLTKLAKDDTLLCRCEEITFGQAKAAIASGATDLHQLKLATRSGMGYCQGRFCSVLAAPLIADATGKSLSSLTPFTARPPIHPLPLKFLSPAFAREDAE